jgi:hypothetical protein
LEFGARGKKQILECHTHVRGMHQRLQFSRKLLLVRLQAGKAAFPFDLPKVRLRGAYHEMVLIGVSSDVQSGTLGRFCKRSKIGVGSNVYAAWIFKRIETSPMP